MLCVRAPKLEKQLKELAQVTGKTKSHFVRTALEGYLREQEEMQLCLPCLNLKEEEQAISM